MRTSLLSRFRGVDGRSLARALAFLILINAVLAGLHTGATAAEPAWSICSTGTTATGTGGAGHPDPGADRPCCVLGCVPAAAALPATGAIPVPSPALREIKTPPLRGVTLAVTEPPASHRPRGPPVLA